MGTQNTRGVACTLGVRNLRTVRVEPPHSHEETQRKPYFTSVFHEAVVSLGFSQHIRAEAELFPNYELECNHMALPHLCYTKL